MFRACTGQKDPPSKSGLVTSVRGVDLAQELQGSNDSTPTGTPILLELVGAVGLASVQMNLDPFCLVKIRRKDNNKEEVLHRTSILNDDTSPIWTIQDKGIALLELEPGQGITVDLCYRKSLAAGIPDGPLVSTTKTIGIVDLTYTQLIQGTGKRQEYNLTPDVKEQFVFLALKYRKATADDVHWWVAFHQDKQPSATKAIRRISQVLPTFIAGDMEFEGADTQIKMFQQRKLVTKDPVTKKQETRYRVWPYEDPDRPAYTKFLSEQQLLEESLKPSKHWVEAGYGEFGTLSLEVLGCKDLPNMDAELIDGKTDAFCACIFEDTIVRTNVIHDTLNPRFMPWSLRAFQFHIAHPSSILYFGVFDFDEGLLDHHDPIGRVVIHLDEFNNDTIYTLDYPLFHGDTQEETHRGVVTLRIRVQWNNPAEASKARSFVAPPRFIINTKSERSFKIMRYLTRGSIDMKEITIKSVKLYFAEFLSHLKKLLYLLDVVTEIYLWRGRLQIGSHSVWFPIRSIVFFSGFVVALEFPHLAFSVALYMIAYCLLVVNYHASRHPYPWHRVRSYRETSGMSLFGVAPTKTRIEASHAGEEAAKQLELLDMYKTERVACFLMDCMTVALKIYNIYSKSVPVDLSTVQRGSGSMFSKLYVNYLRYVHMMLKLLTKYMRLLGNFVNWKSTSTYKVTTNCLLLGTAWLFFPFKYTAVWALRLVVYGLFGPHIKLIDIFLIHKYYRTTEEIRKDGLFETEEEIQKDLESKPKIFRGLLEKPWVQGMIMSGRIVGEETTKLRAFREEKYGKWTETVPALDASRFPNIPEPTSYAQPYKAKPSGQVQNGDAVVDEGDFVDLPDDTKKWEYHPGQHLEGSIVLQPLMRDTHGGRMILPGTHP